MTLALICGFAASESPYCVLSTAKRSRPDPSAEERRQAGFLLARWAQRGSSVPADPSRAPARALWQLGASLGPSTGACPVLPYHNSCQLSASHTHTPWKLQCFLPTHSVSNPSNLKTLFPESDTTKPPFGEGFFSFATFSFFLLSMNVISLQEMIPHILDCLAPNRTVQQKEKQSMRRDSVWKNCLFFIISACLSVSSTPIQCFSHTNTHIHTPWNYTGLWEHTVTAACFAYTQN